MKQIFIISLIIFTGCTNMSFNQLTSDVDVKVEANLEASVKVGEKITGSGSESSFLGIFRIPGVKYRASGNTTSLSNMNPSTYSFLNFFNIVEHAKGEAIHDAITLSNADLIINPKFIITEDDFFLFKTVKCQVTGKKGTIKSIK